MTIKAIISQLHYLMDLNAGRTEDWARLDTVVIGVLARCEIEHLDTKTARLLQKVADEAHRMETEPVGRFVDLRRLMTRPTRRDLDEDGDGYGDLGRDRDPDETATFDARAPEEG